MIYFFRNFADQSMNIADDMYAYEYLPIIIAERLPQYNYNFNFIDKFVDLIRIACRGSYKRRQDVAVSGGWTLRMGCNF